MRYCHIIDKTIGPKGDYVYQVEIEFSYGPDIKPYDPEKTMNRRFIDSNVPRRAIKFIEKPYVDDEHLPNAFRHPIQFPEHLVPEVWKNSKVKPEKL